MLVQGVVLDIQGEEKTSRQYKRNQYNVSNLEGVVPTPGLVLITFIRLAAHFNRFKVTEFSYCELCATL